MSIIDKLHEMAKERGWKCLAESCKNTHEVLWWECDKGHTWEASPVRFNLSVKVCPVCYRASKISSCTKKKTNSSVTKMKVIRSVTKRKTSSSGIKRNASSSGRKRKTIEDMQSLAAERNGKCRSVIYKGANAKHLWECSEKHQWEATPAAVKQGSWCPTCAGNAKPTIEDMQALATERGGKCLSDTYINNATKLTWECNEGHRWESTPNKVKSGGWCKKCYDKTRGDFRRLSIDEMDQIAADRGGKCISRIYVNNRTKLLWECGEGHQWEAVPGTVKKGSWCPVCFQIRNSNRSKCELVAA